MCFRVNRKHFYYFYPVLKAKLFIVVFLFAAHAGAGTVDSLQRIIQHYKKVKQNDSTLTMFYIALIDAYRDTTPFQGLLVANEARQSAIACADRKGLGNIFNKEGNIYFDLGLHAYAVNSYYQNLLINTRLGDWTAVAYAHNDIGFVYYKRELFTLALEQYRKAVYLVKPHLEPASQEVLAHSYNNMAFAFEQMGLPDSALHYFRKSLLIRKRSGYEEKIAQSLAYLGRFSARQKRFVAADKYLDEAIALDRKNNYPVFEAYAWMYKGDNALWQQKYPYAIVCYEEAVRLLQQSGVVREYIRARSRLVSALFASGKNKEAQTLAVAALQDAARLKYYPEQQKLLQQVVDIAKKHGTPKQVIDYQQQLIDSKIIAKQDLAVSTIQQLESNQAVQNGRLSQLIQYKNEQLKFFEKRANAQTREFLIALLVFIILLTIILLATINFRRKTEGAFKRLQRENTLLQQESEKYYATIINKLEDPVSKHNQLIMALSGKRNLFSEADVLHAVRESEDVIKSAELPLLNVLYWARFKSAGLEADPQVQLRVLAEQAMQVNRIDFETRQVQLTNDIDSTIRVRAPKAALQLVFRNLVDNALYHSGEGSFVRVSAREKGKMIEVSVRDNGKGIPGQLVDAFDMSLTGHDVFEGMGLQVCKLICVRSGGDLWMESEEGKGTTVYFTLFNAAL